MTLKSRDFVSQVNDLVDYIESHLDEDLNVESFAQSFEISPFYFQRLFKAYVGDSLGNYIRGRRLDRAASRLKSENTKVIDIALDVGFSSHEAFSRSFRSVFNMTPQQFRQEKPSYHLRGKPKLNRDFLSFLMNGITREPTISIFDEILVVGYSQTLTSPFYDEQQFYKNADRPWELIAQSGCNISNHIEATYCGIVISKSGNYTEAEVDFLVGVPVRKNEPDHSSFACFTILGGKKASFELKDVSQSRARETIDHVYGFWLPNSGYDRGEGVDFLLVENMQVFGKAPFRVSYVIPLK